MHCRWEPIPVFRCHALVLSSRSDWAAGKQANSSFLIPQKQNRAKPSQASRVTPSSFLAVSPTAHPQPGGISVECCGAQIHLVFFLIAPFVSQATRLHIVLLPGSRWEKYPLKKPNPEQALFNYFSLFWLVVQNFVFIMHLSLWDAPFLQCIEHSQGSLVTSPGAFLKEDGGEGSVMVIMSLLGTYTFLVRNPFTGELCWRSMTEHPCACPASFNSVVSAS